MKKILLAITTFILLSCSKNQSDPPQMVLNTQPNTIFKLYSNITDWKNEMNPIVDTQAGADGRIILKGFTNGDPYYFDMYSSDSMYSNWQSKDYNDKSSVQFIYNNSLRTSNYQPNAIAWKLLLGNDKQTKWKLIDVRELTGDGSIWSTMTDCEKDIELVFKKDFICVLNKRTKTSGCTAAETINYDFYVDAWGTQIFLRSVGSGISTHLIDVIEETVGTNKVKRLRVQGLFNNSKIGIFTKE